MVVDTSTISAVFTGLAGLLVAVASLVTARGKRATVRRREYRSLERRFLAALAHIFALETDLAELGRTPPPRPDALDDPDDEQEPGPSPGLPPPPRPAPGGTGSAA